MADVKAVFYLLRLNRTMMVACAGLSAARSTPRLAYVLTLVCIMGVGTLICVAVVLGS